MSSKMGKVLIVLLSVNLAALLALGTFLYFSSESIKQQQRVLERRVEDIEPCENSSEESIAVISAIMSGELESKVDEVTVQISEQIAYIEDSLGKYDKDIASISASLEELNDNMENVNSVILSLQEILDSIKNFLNID